MKSFLVISAILALLQSPSSFAGIEQILSAKSVVDLRHARDRDLRQKINRQTCAYQLQLKHAPLNCGYPVIEVHCRGELDGWTIAELKRARGLKELSSFCRQKMNSTLDIRFYQSADEDFLELGLSLEEMSTNGKDDSTKPGSLRAE